jgi:hypothetical protein
VINVRLYVPLLDDDGPVNENSPSK